MFQVEGLDHIAITVSDLEASVKWYEQVLGLKNDHPGLWGGVPVMMFAVIGSSGLALFPAKANATLPDNLGNLIATQHIAFRVSRASFEAAQAHLHDLRIPFKFQDHDISHSIYFDDPDQHRLELTTYEF
jgi:catechol 2,3-dioxygenase-like lactoylglutathione lyase family enzyme